MLSRNSKYNISKIIKIIIINVHNIFKHIIILNELYYDNQVLYNAFINFLK